MSKLKGSKKREQKTENRYRLLDCSDVLHVDGGSFFIPKFQKYYLKNEKLRRDRDGERIEMKKMGEQILESTKKEFLGKRGQGTCLKIIDIDKDKEHLREQNCMEDESILEKILLYVWQHRYREPVPLFLYCSSGTYYERYVLGQVQSEKNKHRQYSRDDFLFFRKKQILGVG